MKALVTGANGFVGGHLLRHLADCGDVAVGVDHECDVTDARSVRAMLDETQPDAIYHLAALTHVGESWTNSVEFTRVNVLGTKNVLQSAHDAVPNASIVLVSSADVYGIVRPADLPLRETSRVVPANPYASSKVEAEHVAHDAVREWRSRVVIARPFNHIGPGQSATFVVPALVNRLLESLESGIDEIAIGDLSTRRDFCDVRDVVRAYRLLSERGISGDVYNIASGRDVLLLDLAHELVAEIAPKARLVFEDRLSRPVEVPVMRGSFEKLQHATGWEPTIPLSQSLHDVIDDMRERRSTQ